MEVDGSQVSNKNVSGFFARACFAFCKIFIYFQPGKTFDDDFCSQRVHGLLPHFLLMYNTASYTVG